MSDRLCASLCALGVAAASAGCTEPARSGWSGYAEGDYVMVAAPVAGTLALLSVQAGQTVARDAPLFVLESDVEQAARAEARARAAAAQAQARSTESGRRDDELAVTRAQLAQAHAQAGLARREFARQQQLLSQGFVSQARLDDARTAVAQSTARVAELDAALPHAVHHRLRQGAGDGYGSADRRRRRRHRSRGRLRAAGGAGAGQLRITFQAFSARRTLAIFIKEFQQMMRDRLTFAMAVAVPIMQMVLFGYAINTDPRGLPTVLVAADSGPLARSLTATLQNSGYFRITHSTASEYEAEALVERGTAQFMIAAPPDFDARVVRGERPALLVSVDATDPSASGNAIAALAALAPLAPLRCGPALGAGVVARRRRPR